MCIISDCGHIRGSRAMQVKFARDGCFSNVAGIGRAWVHETDMHNPIVSWPTRGCIAQCAKAYSPYYPMLTGMRGGFWRELLNIGPVGGKLLGSSTALARDRQHIHFDDRCSASAHRTT